ncbi:31301_t:CDS:2, partial [Racocetra persica]
QIAKLIEKKDHLTKKGMKKILELREKMNNGGKHRYSNCEAWTPVQAESKGERPLLLAENSNLSVYSRKDSVWYRNPTVSVKAKGCLTVRLTSRTDAKAGLSDPAVLSETTSTEVFGTLRHWGEVVEIQPENLTICWDIRFLNGLELIDINSVSADNQQETKGNFLPRMIPQVRLRAENVGDKKTKVVPKLIHRFLTARSLAYWFMDDGSYHVDKFGNRQYYLNTQSFSSYEQKRLVAALNTKFSLKFNVHKDKNKYRLYLKFESKKKFLELISPFILPSMDYKLKEQ